MGNKIGKKRQVVDEKYTRPQGLYQHRYIDHKKLRKLILDSKLALCYPGLDDHSLNLEECPICFLYYPSLNRSRCCMKGICTECFLQMKPSRSTRLTLCPFCKTSNYAVEYRGAKTKEEKSVEQVKVIEAQIRIQQQELQDEAERIKKRQDINSSSIITTPTDVECHDIIRHSNITRQNNFGPSQSSCSALANMRFPHARHNSIDVLSFKKKMIIPVATSLGVVGPVPRKFPTDHQGKSGSAYGGQSRCPASFDCVPHLEENSCKYAVARDRTAGP